MKPIPLIPRPPRRMRQPTKDALRDELSRAASTIEQLRAENERLRMPWWRRLINRGRPVTAGVKPRPVENDGDANAHS